MSTHTQATATSVHSAIAVDVGIDRAFRVFTEDFDEVKPREHTMLAVEIDRTVFEPRAGGRVYDRGVDGSECQWARVLVFEPPNTAISTVMARAGKACEARWRAATAGRSTSNASGRSSPGKARNRR